MESNETRTEETRMSNETRTIGGAHVKVEGRSVTIYTIDLARLRELAETEDRCGSLTDAQMDEFDSICTKIEATGQSVLSLLDETGS